MARTQITAELRRIQESHGGLLRAADVVAEASRQDSPLHDHFTWDDNEAGHQWRLQQARQLIRVTVQTLPYDEPHYLVRAFVSLSPDRLREAGGYKEMAAVLHSPFDRRQLVLDCLDELNRLKSKYFQLTELSAVFEKIDQARRDFGGSPPPPDNGDNGDHPSA